jgi:hypothetical protein
MPEGHKFTFFPQKTRWKQGESLFRHPPTCSGNDGKAFKREGFFTTNEHKWSRIRAYSCLFVVENFFFSFPVTRLRRSLRRGKSPTLSCEGRLRFYFGGVLCIFTEGRSFFPIFQLYSNCARNASIKVWFSIRIKRNGCFRISIKTALLP